jgi:hypothetical protein
MTAEQAKEPSLCNPRGRLLVEMEAAFPGWQIWYILGHGARATWCARRLPVLECDSACALVQQICALGGIAVPLLDTVTMDNPMGDGRLHALDRMQLEVRATFPNWHTTFSPHRDGPVAWTSYRKPLLHADSPEALAHDIRLLEAEAAAYQATR